MVLVAFANMSLGCAHSPSYFTVERVSCEKSYHGTGAQIIITSAPCYCGYDRTGFSSMSPKTRIEIAEALLTLDGDLSVCALLALEYSPIKSRLFYSLSKRTYSIQLEALFIVNMLCIEDHLMYSSYPLLQNHETKEFLFGFEEEMSDVFAHYRNWLAKVKTLGLESINKKKIYPLDDSPYSWY